MSDFSAAFQERLQAMARTHEFLSRHNWEGADLEQLLRSTLSPYAVAERQSIALDGRAFQLNANAAATLGMVFFELASNAAKYGALAVENGHVEVAWRVDNPHALSIVWKETGGPTVEAEPKPNFGTTFIQQSLQYELGGSAELKFGESGFKCVLEIPLSRMETAGVSSLAAPERS
jgi:two-component system CheB/CheR fusion protein